MPSNLSSRFLSARIQLLLIGLLTVVLDLTIFRFLLANAGSVADLPIASAHMTSFMLAAVFGGLLTLIGPLNHLAKMPRLPRFLTWLLIALLILFLRGGLLASLVQTASVPLITAQLIAAVFSGVVLFGAITVFSFYRPTEHSAPEKSLDTVFLLITGYAVLLRLLYLGAPELLFEEAYYWNYAQHLDIGYLDHPLMVAWLIKATTSLLGNIEFAVRLGAFMCWFVTAYCIFKLTLELFNRSTAYRALAIMAVLPVYFFFGFFMSPDAPMTACWAMAVYFFYQIIVNEKKHAWLGLGLAIGLGLISKYTIALLGAAMVLFLLIDQPSRKWFTRPGPYLAVVIVLLLFSPVVIWNFQHDWASFTFQSQGRLASKFSFSLPRFIGNVILFLTPTGVLSVLAIALSHKPFLANIASFSQSPTNQLRRNYFLLVWLALFPVAVFAAISLFRASKLNWTGPSWLALVPLLALLLTPKLVATSVTTAVKASVTTSTRLLAWCCRAWIPTLVICLLFYGATLHWLSLGLPGAGYPKNLHLIGWRTFGREMEQIITKLEQETGEKILVVGMDRNKIASGLAFYRTQYIETHKEKTSHVPALQTASEHLFASVGLMYEFWFPLAQQHGKTLLLVSNDRTNLQTNRVLERVKTAGEIAEVIVSKNGQPSGRYYYRLVKGYQEKSTTNEPSDTSDSGSSE
ncbi:MAG: glycosyltransferase family 39 protein [Rugosibacter sp.]|nr:glycosyltransferase family 39 protein [Rugosibacter sp.]